MYGFGKKKVIFILALAALAIFLAYRSLYKPEKASIDVVSTNSGKGPITGTYLVHDYDASASQLNTLFDEMAQTGLDTVVIIASGSLNSDKCQPEQMNFTETYILDDGWGLRALKAAKAHNFKVYIGLSWHNQNCLPVWSGNIGDVNSPAGRIYDFNLRLMDKIKNTFTTQGWDQSDPFFAGYYIQEFPLDNFVTTNANKSFFKTMIGAIKTKDPTKPLLFSPWSTDAITYNAAKTAFTDLYSYGVDIIAPQDAMGGFKVTSYDKSAEIHRALSDAAKSLPNKKAWADIESFTRTVNTPPYFPSTIDKVSQQIAAAAPYTDKMLTWAYEHTMLSNPTFDNITNWGTVYTYNTDNANKRRKLRSDYLAKYDSDSACQTMWYYNGSTQKCEHTGDTTPYNPNTHMQCGSGSNICEDNLKTYIPAALPVCYRTEELCQSTNTSLSPSPSATSTLPPVPGDFTGDGHVTLADYNKLVANFGTLYHLSDYNQLVANFGK